MRGTKHAARAATRAVWTNARINAEELLKAQKNVYTKGSHAI